MTDEATALVEPPAQKTPVKRKRRPSKAPEIDPARIEEARQYLTACGAWLPEYKVGRPKTYTQDVVVALGWDLLDWLNADKRRWQIAQWCSEKGIMWQRLSEWAQSSPEFQRCYEQALQEQKVRLLNLGVGPHPKNMRYDTTVIKMVLVNYHGFKDRSEQDLNVNAAPPLETAEDCKKAIELAQEKLRQIEQHEEQVKNMLETARTLEPAVVQAEGVTA